MCVAEESQSLNLLAEAFVFKWCSKPSRAPAFKMMSNRYMLLSQTVP